MLVLAIAWVLFVPAADWLAHHDVGSAKGPLLQTARDTARGRLLTLGAGLFAGAALLFAARDAQVQEPEFRRYVQDAAGSGNTADQLTKLADLRDRGVITGEEFDREKAKILA